VSGKHGKDQDAARPELGARLCDGGVRFDVYAHAELGVELLLFGDVEDAEPQQVLPLDPLGDGYWGRFVPGLEAGQLYGYRVLGGVDLERGLRSDPDKLLMDPYARGIGQPRAFSRAAASRPGSNFGQALKSVVLDVSSFDWSGDSHPRHSWAETVIYEMHVGGFTRHESSGLPYGLRGTYLGMIEKIPYLQELGITAVELLPVQQFDVQDAPEGLSNYWGYSPIAFFAPHLGYATRPEAQLALDEFRQLVRALHAAGIEVLLDVVYNHTAEFGVEGPNYCYRGLANDVYYLLRDGRTRYLDVTGTGNTLNANHPVVRTLILDSLRYWVQEMHVDGFRFDLAASLRRGIDGEEMEDPPLIREIADDPVLADTKLIAEPWDAAGLYAVGKFADGRWVEWNDRFRDDARRFVRGEEGVVGELRSRLLGSPDLFGVADGEASPVINFVTCHDGFTLNDLVSYEQKHNEANRGDAHSGADWNISCNHGVEGPSDDAEVEALRNRQAKNLLSILLVSRGTPMLLMGDEVRRTQQGNNNPYCVDAPLSWMDWDLLRENPGMLRFTQKWLSLRGLLDLGGEGLGELTWHGVALGQPDGSEHSRAIAFTARCEKSELLCHVMLNGWEEALEFELPPPSEGESPDWFRRVDTFLESPADIGLDDVPPRITTPGYWVAPRSFVLLTAGKNALIPER
jgi:isoamylase